MKMIYATTKTILSMKQCTVRFVGTWFNNISRYVVLELDLYITDTNQTQQWKENSIIYTYRY